MPRKAINVHPFGELLARYRARKPGFTQRHLAELAGYDPAILARMVMGKKDLTGPSGRDRIVRIIESLADLQLLSTVAQANELLGAAAQAPLFDGHAVEARLLSRLSLGARNYRVRRTNLPAALTSFIGRSKEVEEIRRLLAGARLVTLMGVGGCGKTRLAQRVGADVLLDYADGVWYVELAAVSHGDMLTENIARIFGLPAGEQAILGVLIDHLRERHALLILDNCEHLLDSAANVAMELLKGCPRLSVLTTSRESLNVDGEFVWLVPSMDAPEAIQLFVERSKTVRAVVEDTPLDSDIVSKICGRLDRMPLAIELAASHLASVGLDGIADRLDDRLNLLTRNRRGAPPRHQTLRAVIDWSHDLLTDAESRLFKRQAVFAGGWTLEQTIAVVADEALSPAHVQTLLMSLVAKSLVSVYSDDSGVRYRYLETIREYALEQLRKFDEYAQMRRAHAIAFANLSDKLWNLSITDIATVIRHVRSDYDNLIATLEWSFGPVGDVVHGCRVIMVMWQFWDYATAYGADGRHWFQVAFESITSAVPDRLRGWLYLLHFFFVDNYDQHTYLANTQQAHKLLFATDDVWGKVLALAHLSHAHHYVLRDEVGAAEWLTQCTAMARRSGDIPTVQSMLAASIIAAEYSGRHQDAERLALELIDVARGGDDQLVVCDGLIELGRAYEQTNRLEDARATYEQARELSRQRMDPGRQALAAAMNAQIAASLGEIELAVALAAEGCALVTQYPDSLVGTMLPTLIYARALSATREYRQAHQLINRQLRRKPPRIRWIGWYVGVLEAKAIVTSRQGLHIEAATLFGAADADCDRTNGSRDRLDALELGECANQTRSALGAEAYAAAYAAGHAMTWEQAVEYALLAPS